MSATKETLYLEDIVPGRIFTAGPYVLEREELIAFARDYDPQPFHLDEAAAAKTPYGGLIASGWQSVGILMRLIVEAFVGRTISMGSPGVDEVRWLKPVRPGDRLSARVTCVEQIPSRSKPDRGICKFVYELVNQDGEVAVRMKGMGMFGRRPGSAT
ncbi:MAG: MaoC family dehydratase [Alphaproteobacteria bacterium]|nr:MaoC family dehydratase [Alphaproteobacteria bacterium]